MEPQREKLLKIDEVAEWLRLAPTSVQRMMKTGKFRRGVHYVRPPGLGTRFKESAIQNWLDEKEQKDPQSDGIKMVKGYEMGRIK